MKPAPKLNRFKLLHPARWLMAALMVFASPIWSEPLQLEPDPRANAKASLTHELMAIPTAAQANEILALYESRFGQTMQTTQIYPLGLLACAMVLLAGIAWAIVALQSANRHLESRVAERTRELSGKNAALLASISEQQRVSAALSVNEQLFRTLSNFSPAGVYKLDCDGIFIYGNPRFYQIVALNFEQMERHEWIGRVHPEDQPRVIEEWKRFLTACGVCDLEFRLQFPGEVRWVQISSAPIYTDGNISGHVGLMTDITERKNTEASIKQMELQLQQGQKLESVGRLAAGVAHELNTPIQYVADNTRFIQENFNSVMTLLHNQEQMVRAVKQNTLTPEQLAEADQLICALDLKYLSEEIPTAIKETLEGVDRVSRIVQAMKEFSHPGSQEKKLADLNRAISTTITVARNEWKSVAEVRLDLEPNLPLVKCLLDEFNQCILNLVVNAVHAIRDQLREDADAKGVITIQTRKLGEEVVVRVIDTGTGIPEPARAHIFEPFFTTKPVGKGTGQGLSMVYNSIVKKQGGQVSFETELGQGTCFIIKLPVGNAQAGSTQLN